MTGCATWPSSQGGESLAPALASHPTAVYLREDPIRDAVNSWIGHLFDRTNVDRTVAALVAYQDGGAEQVGHEAAKKRLADAEARLRRFQTAIASGVDPAALVDVINEAQAQRAAARAELDGTPAPNLLADGEVYAMVDSLGDVGAAVADATEESLANLYAAIDLQVRYEPAANAADVGVRLARRVNSAGVRGGIGHGNAAHLRNAGVHMLNGTASGKLKGSTSFFKPSLRIPAEIRPCASAAHLVGHDADATVAGPPPRLWAHSDWIFSPARLGGSPPRSLGRIRPRCRSHRAAPSHPHGRGAHAS